VQLKDFPTKIAEYANLLTSFETDWFSAMLVLQARFVSTAIH
jgi:hypothetical protein